MVVVLCLFSILPFRRRAFELFLKTHQLFAIALVSLLWVHVQWKITVATVSLAVFTFLWAVQRLLWLYLIFLRNHGPGHNIVRLEAIDEDAQRGVQAVLVWIHAKKAQHPKAGQYVYLTLKHVGGQTWPLLQSHPYQIAWSDGDGVSSQDLGLIVETRNGFSRGIRYASGQHAILDGPYGISHSLGGFSKVVFLTSGVGIAGVLLYIRSLLRAHNANVAMVRRLSLVWLVDSSGKMQLPSFFVLVSPAVVQQSWVKRFLDDLLDEDERNILTGVIYVPYDIQSDKLIELRPRLFQAKSPLRLEWTLEKEFKAEMGSMAVLGTKEFPPIVR